MQEECHICDAAFSYNWGIKGNKSDITKLLFIMHRSDSRALQTSIFGTDYHTALSNTKTGEVLFDILKFCNLTIDDVFLTNVFKCMLPGDRKPSKQEYVNCLSVLERQIEEFQPRKIVVFGTEAYDLLFLNCSNKKSHKKAIGMMLNYNNIPLFVSYHPNFIGTMLNGEKEEKYRQIADFCR